MAVESAKALAQVYQQLIEQEPSRTVAAQRWAGVLMRPPLDRLGDACDVLEAAADTAGHPGAETDCPYTTRPLKDAQLAGLSPTTL